MLKYHKYYMDLGNTYIDSRLLNSRQSFPIEGMLEGGKHSFKSNTRYYMKFLLIFLSILPVFPIFKAVTNVTKLFLLSYRNTGPI